MASNPAMQDFCINNAQTAIKNHGSDKEIAAVIRNVLQKKYGTSSWHCFVGRDFGCFVSHVEECYCYFYVGNVGVTIFAT